MLRWGLPHFLITFAVSFAESSRPHFQALPLETTGEGVDEPASANLSNGSKEHLPSLASNSTDIANATEESESAVPHFFLLQTLDGNPACLLVVQGLLMAICFYLLLKAVIDYVAQSASTRIENPFESIAKDSPVASQKWIDYFGFGGGKELGSLEDAFRGLTSCQWKYVRAVMLKSHRLRQTGIKEQRKSADWKMVELVSVSVTPIFISIMGNFGEAFRQPIQLLAIALSLVSTICQLAPLGRGEVMLTYSAKLETLCWTYWSVTGRFEEERKKNMQTELETEAAKSAKAQGYWSMFHQRLREDRSNLLKHVKEQQEVEADDANGDGHPSRRQAFSREPDKEEVDAYLSSPLTSLECARAMLFPKFVELCAEEMEAGEAELQKSFAAPRLTTGQSKKRMSQDLSTDSGSARK